MPPGERNRDFIHKTATRYDKATNTTCINSYHMTNPSKSETHDVNRLVSRFVIMIMKPGIL